jgi:dienelactone hydrolase
LEGFVRGPAPTSASASRAGPFDVDVVIFGLRDGPAYGSQTLHVPEGAEPPFAGVVVVPGFISPEASTRPWGPFLASHGIVTLTIGTNTGGDLPDVRARALLDAIETLKAENTRAGGPVEGQMALDRFAVMGWSMGGGGTLIAANGNPELRAAVSLAAWSPAARFTNDRVPTLLLAGSLDLVAGGQSQGFFESIPESTPKMLFEIAGGGHDIANNPISAGGEVGLYGLSWLKVFLEGDERYRQFLLEPPSRQSDFRTNL